MAPSGLAQSRPAGIPSSQCAPCKPLWAAASTRPRAGKRADRTPPPCRASLRSPSSDPADGGRATISGDASQPPETLPLAPPPPPPPLPPPEQQPTAPPGGSSQLEGLGYLLLVALLWGSYTPAVRLAYTLPGPPTPTALTAASGCVELAVLLAAAVLTGALGAAQPSAAAPAPPPAAGGSKAGPSAADEAGTLPLGLPAAVLAGLEIGAYNSAASFAQIAGLSLTTATRGAFLVQASTLFTPALSALAGMAPGGLAWAGSLLAFAGTLVITQDGSGGGGSAETAAAAATGAVQPLGDALTLAAALCYSAATVRIPAWAVRRRVSPLQLALGKAAFLAAVATGALALQAAQLAADGQPAAQLWPGWQQPAGWAVVVWAALGPGALASVLHVKGQSLVSPTAAQIVFCSVPVWSALLAAAALPGEAVGPATLAGGVLVAAAGLVAGKPQPAQKTEAGQNSEPPR